ncbi:venom metalloproteinase antarease TserMP_A-like [Ornithodoros turicata]|uniref:venom metalloproteinase antarease TserMP_A-like n=1 Tax=Ornithodoros turicata TaxID=34597 RepID=UPI003139A7FC
MSKDLACLVLVISLTSCEALTLTSKQVVYPHLVEGRTNDGPKVLMIKDDLTLNLLPSKVFSDVVTVSSFRKDGTPLRYQFKGAKYEEGLHHDSEKLASVFISYGDGLQVEGIVSPSFAIKPMKARERSPEGHVAHQLFHIDDSSGGYKVMDYVVPRDPKEQGYSALEDSNSGMTGDEETDASQARVAPSESVEILERIGNSGERNDVVYYPEVHFVFHSRYAKVYKYNKTSIIRYLAIVINAVNLKYDTLKLQRVQIRILGLTIERDVTSESYITKFGKSKYVDAKTTLSKMAEHFHANKDFKRADLFFLVTSFDLASARDNNNLDNKTDGMAMAAAVCTKNKVAICEDDYQSYKLVRCFAHEVAHSLGCVHDGEAPLYKGHPGAKACGWDLGYLMSYVTGTEREHQFSPCCDQQMKNLLSLENFRCVRTTYTVKKNYTSDLLPGYVITADTLCFRSYKDTGHTYFKDKSKPMKNCRIACRTEYTNTTVLIDGKLYMQSTYETGEVAAVDGIACGTNEVCYNGVCGVQSKYPRKKKTKTKKNNKIKTKKNNKTKTKKNNKSKKTKNKSTSKKAKKT